MIRKKSIRDLYTDASVVAANHSGQILHDAHSLMNELSTLADADEAIRKLVADYTPAPASRIKISNPTVDESDPAEHLNILSGRLRTIAANLARAAEEIADRRKLLDSLLSQ
jgi:hypothetical protein